MDPGCDPGPPTDRGAQSGQVCINCYQACDSALPFGGYKASGWGRETCRQTLNEYTELKTVVLSLGPA